MATPKLNQGMILTLQALRAAPMDSTQLQERIVSVSSYLSRLVQFGYVVFHSGYYKITPEGRDACPNRRDLEVKPKLSGVHEKNQANISKFKKKQAESPIGSAMFEHLIQHGKTRGGDLCKIFNTVSVNSYLNKYINAGQVVSNRISGTRFLEFDLSWDYRQKLSASSEQQAVPALTEKETEMQDKKITNVDIVRLVAENPGITTLGLQSKLGVIEQPAKNRLSVAISNCITQRYITRKKTQQSMLILGDNELWLAQHGLLDTTKGGVAAAQLESEAKPAEQQTSPEAQAETSSLGGGGQSDAEGTAIPAEPTAQPLQSNEVIGVDVGLGDIGLVYEIPAFLRKDFQADIHNSAELDLESIKEAGPGKLVILPDPVIKKPRFAYTSDRTLMIFNVQEQPIELTPEATAALDEFLGDLWLNERDDHIVAAKTL